MPKPYLVDIYRDPLGLRVRILNGKDKSIVCAFPRSFRGAGELRKNLESLVSSLEATIANLHDHVNTAKHD